MLEPVNKGNDDLSEVPTGQQVDSLLKLKKGLIKSLSWSEKSGNYSPICYQYYSAGDLDNGSILEGVGIRAMWRESPIEGVQPKYNFAMHMGNHRVLAFDFDWRGEHKNKVGRGLPYYNQKVRGPHKHLWAEGKYGYAEPLDELIISRDISGHWQHFCDEANIIKNNEFSSPYFDENSGQGRLL